MLKRVLPSVVVVLLATADVVLAQSSPFDGLNTGGRAYSDPALYAKAKAQWLARVDAAPENVDVLEGAADFFIVRERPLAAELLERAQKLEPNNSKWVQRLAQLHRLNAASGDVAEAKLALSLMERAYAMSAAAGRQSASTYLPAMAFDAGDLVKAREYAERLLFEATNQSRSWPSGDAVHKGNIVLGRIAVVEGRLTDAVQFLRASVEIEGPSLLTSFGPNMSLAKDLLERGETESVLSYFEACRVFWKLGEKFLDAWRQDVQAGRIPNFGANLRY